MNEKSSIDGVEKEREEDERYRAWMARHPEPQAAPEGLRESGPGVAEFEAMITLFESVHSIEALHVLTDLAPKDAPHHPVHEPARVALIPIVAKLIALKNETDISPATYEALNMQYRRLSQAVGIIHNKKVIHDR